MVLIPEIVDAVDIPVLGAGGIGRGRQMAAAMALGAEGVWCGSVWLTTEEAETHPAVKEKFLRATSADTVRSRSRTGKHARQLVTAWTEEWDRPDTPDPLAGSYFVESLTDEIEKGARDYIEKIDDLTIKIEWSSKPGIAQWQNGIGFAAFMPEPQTLLMVVQPTPCGRPAASAVVIVWFGLVFFYDLGLIGVYRKT